MSSKNIYKWPVSTGKASPNHESLRKCKLKPQRDINSHPVGWLLSKTNKQNLQKITSVGEAVQRREPLYTASGNVKWCRQLLWKTI